MNVCISGASGLVGNELLIQTLNNTSVEKVLVLARNPLDFSHPKMQVVVIPFTQLSQLSVEEKIDVAYCSLGTTLRKAGSKAMQQEIDRDYVVAFGAFCKKAGVERIGIVSAAGSNKESRNFYLRTKGEMEQGIIELDIPVTTFIRPAFLIGSRKEKRPGEKLVQALALITNPLLVGKAKAYRSIHVSKVASKLIETTLTGEMGVHII